MPNSIRLAAIDLEPASEIRRVDSRVRHLVVDTGLREAAAEAAWVTVSDDQGVVYFEGSPSADGCVAVSFENAPGIETAHVMLETAKLHRQAQVTLGDGWTAHAFA